MYTPTWLSNQSLIESLQLAPGGWQYAQAMRLLIHYDWTLQKPLSIFSLCDARYRFASEDLISVSKKGQNWYVTTTKPALTGYKGVLPYVYQDLELQQRLSRDVKDVQGVFSIFNQRILQLTFETTSRASVGYRYEDRCNKSHPLSRTLLTLAGLPLPVSLPLDNLLRYASVLGRKTTNLSLLEIIIKHYFCIDVELQRPSIMRKYLTKDSLCRLRVGVDQNTSGEGGYLGGTALIGQSCYLYNPSICVVICVDNKEQYRAVTSDKSLPTHLNEFCHLYFAGDAQVRLQIRCPRYCLSTPRLCSRSAKETTEYFYSAARLGRLSCLVPHLYASSMVIADFPEVSYAVA